MKRALIGWISDLGCGTLGLASRRTNKLRYPVLFGACFFLGELTHCYFPVPGSLRQLRTAARPAAPAAHQSVGRRACWHNLRRHHFVSRSPGHPFPFQEFLGKYKSFQLECVLALFSVRDGPACWNRDCACADQLSAYFLAAATSEDSPTTTRRTAGLAVSADSSCRNCAGAAGDTCLRRSLFHRVPSRRRSWRCLLLFASNERHAARSGGGSPFPARVRLQPVPTIALIPRSRPAIRSSKAKKSRPWLSRPL